MNISTRSFVASIVGAFAVGAIFFVALNHHPTATTPPNSPPQPHPIPTTATSAASSNVAPPLSDGPQAVQTPASTPTTGNAVTTNSVVTEETAASRIHRNYMFATDSGTKIDLLDALTLISDGAADALDVIHMAFSDSDPAVRRQALLVLAANGIFWSADLLPYLETGLADPSLTVQDAANRLLSSVGLGRYPRLILKGLSSQDAGTRQRTLAMINVTTTTVPINVYAEAIKSTNSGTRLVVIDILCQQQAKRGIPLLIQALNDPDKTVRVEAQHNLFFLLDENFDTQEEAAAFWRENSARYSESIFDNVPTIESK